MIDPEEKCELLQKLFAHTLSENEKVRAAAYTALGQFSMDYSVLTCLLAGLEDGCVEVRESAAQSLQNWQ